MLLRNYDNIVAALSLASYDAEKYGDEATFGDGYLTVHTTRNTKRRISAGEAMPMNRFTGPAASSEGYSWIVLGSGSTPVIYDDYKLENELTTSQIGTISSSGIAGTPIYNEQNKTWTKTFSYDFQAKSDITVSEIGVTYRMYSTTDRWDVLVYREVLDTPISVTTGQYISITITTSISANPNKPADVSASALVVE